MTVREPQKCSNTSDEEIGIMMEENGLSHNNEWARQGTYFQNRSRADKFAKLPPGIYEFVPTPSGWFLNCIGAEFTFAFKVYAAAQHILDRITKFWNSNPGNLGILMNGLRGAGKTMTAQLLANRLIREQRIPVVVVRSPIPLDIVLGALHQEVLVIFDEFEKTHDEEAQLSLLSVIDGMSRSEFRRMFVFTTNTTSINENFVDRPSRIHYQFQFNRVADEVIEGLIDDSLPAHLNKFKSDIVSFLSTRAICTIDIVKAVIAEVKTFEESPLSFEGLLNIQKGEPPAFKVSIVNRDTNEVQDEWLDRFKPSNSQYASLLMGSKQSLEKFLEEDGSVFLEINHREYNGNYTICLLEKAEEPGMWYANLKVPKAGTPFQMMYNLGGDGYAFWLDEKPDNWALPVESLLDATAEEKSKVRELWQQSINTATAHGTGKRAIFKILIEENRTKFSYYSRHRELMVPD